MVSILFFEREAMAFMLFGFIQWWLQSLYHRAKQRLRQWTCPDNSSDSLAFGTALDLARSKSELVLENALLRQQLIVLQRQGKRPILTWRDRGLFVLLASKLPSWRTALLIVQPDTILRWHRDLFRRVWRRKSQRKGKDGRQPLAEDIVTLIQDMARENRTWGAERIRGELLKLGVTVAKSTIQRYINQVRGPLSGKQTWSTFLRNHAQDIWAVDFLQTYDLFFRTLFVLVIIELESPRLVHFGVTRSPEDAWVAQQLREATPFDEGPRFLIRDNDNKFGAAFARVAEGTGIEVLTTPYQAPKANAICERFLGSVRRECLDFFLIFNEHHLRKIMKQYQAYFNQARPHQGLDQRIPCPTEQSEEQPDRGKIISLPVLGGLHHDYQRRAGASPSLPRAA
jgi:transposase InsO family protein